MKIWLIAGLFALAVMLSAFQGIPRCTSVDPETAKTGTVVTAKGENLGKASIAEVYLTATVPSFSFFLSFEKESEPEKNVFCQICRMRRKASARYLSGTGDFVRGDNPGHVTERR